MLFFVTVVFCPLKGKWALEHEDFVRGMIYARIEPWKFAVGYCFGKGKCDIE